MTRPRTTVTRTPTVPPRLTIYYIDAQTGKLVQHTDGREWRLPAVGSTLGLAGIGRWRVTGTKRIDDTHWDVVVAKVSQSESNLESESK